MVVANRAQTRLIGHRNDGGLKNFVPYNCAQKVIVMVSVRWPMDMRKTNDVVLCANIRWLIEDSTRVQVVIGRYELVLVSGLKNGGPPPDMIWGVDLNSELRDVYRSLIQHNCQ